MKKITFVLFLLASVSAFAYQTGRPSRPQFSTAPAAAAGENQEKAKEDKPAAPGQQGVQTRSFTSYSSRPGNAWRQGVQTKTVQTQTATDAAKPKNEQAVKDQLIQRSQPVAQPKADNKDAAKQGKSAAPEKEEKPKAEPAPADAGGAAVMKQLQGLQGMMGALGGAPAANAGAKPNAGATPAMPAGMPDMSALMNMAGQGKKK